MLYFASRKSEKISYSLYRIRFFLLRKLKTKSNITYCEKINILQSLEEKKNPNNPVRKNRGDRKEVINAPSPCSAQHNLKYAKLDLIKGNKEEHQQALQHSLSVG